MTNQFTRRTYFRETISFDETPTRDQMQSLVKEGFKLDRRNLLWERKVLTSQRHEAGELQSLLGSEVETPIASPMAA